MLLKTARRLVIILLGFTVVLIGVIMIVAPGPAIIVIPAGLAILGTEFLWAKRLLNRIKRKTGAMLGKFEPVICTNCETDLVGKALKDNQTCPDCGIAVPSNTAALAANEHQKRTNQSKN